MTENSNREEKRRRRERENKREAVGRRKGEVRDVTPGNEDSRSERKAEERGGEVGGGGQEVFNYSARRQQRPRFQETITVGSLWGEAHLASFIPPILVSPHTLQVGIFNVFFCCTKQTHARAHVGFLGVQTA